VVRRLPGNSDRHQGSAHLDKVAGRRRIEIGSRVGELRARLEHTEASHIFGGVGERFEMRASDARQMPGSCVPGGALRGAARYRGARQASRPARCLRRPGHGRRVRFSRMGRRPAQTRAKLEPET
jgi:hypothetical protein